MHADFERVIALQHLDTEATRARSLRKGQNAKRRYESRLAEAKQRVADAKAQLAANQEARRAIDKDVALHQGRLSKYRDQAMAVKTNQEYHAIQHEIAHAQGEIKTHEDAMLERMVEADELAATIKTAEADLATEQKTIEADRKTMQAEHAALETRLDKRGGDRTAILAAIDKQVLWHLRARGRPAAGDRGRGSERRHLHDLPRPAPPAGVQHRAPQRQHHPV